jgi:hypothetical protein
MSEWYEPEPPTPGYGPPGRADDGEPYLPGPGFAASPPGAARGWPGPVGGLAGWDDAGQPEDWQRVGSDASTAPYPALPAPARRGRGGPPRRRTGLLAAAAALLAAALAVTILTARPHARPAPRAAAAASSARPAASPSSRPAAPAATPAITRAAARLLLTRYVAANNAANQSRSTAELAQIEGGSSYQLDAGGYQFLTAADPANTGYQAFGFTPAAWYIPRLPGYPQWFAVYGTWSGTRSAPFRGYLLFAQSAPGRRWLQVLEPSLTGAAAAPAPVTDTAGYAAAAPAGSGGGLAAAPGSLPAATAARLDGDARGVAITGLQPLGDQQDQAFWAVRVPRGTGDTDRHTATRYGVYALRTAAGGALVFYSLAATLTIVPPPGQPVTLKIPGYYSPAEPVTTAATVPYADQFAAWIGPRGSQAAVRVIAQNSGIAARA